MLILVQIIKGYIWRFHVHEESFYGLFYTYTHSKISTETNQAKLYICL